MHRIDPDTFQGVYFNRVTFMKLENTEARGSKTLFAEDGITLFCEDTSEGIPNPKIEVFIADEIVDMILASVSMSRLKSMLKHKRAELQKDKENKP